MNDFFNLLRWNQTNIKDYKGIFYCLQNKQIILTISQILKTIYIYIYKLKDHSKIIVYYSHTIYDNSQN